MMFLKFAYWFFGSIVIASVFYLCGYHEARDRYRKEAEYEPQFRMINGSDICVALITDAIQEGKDIDAVSKILDDYRECEDSIEVIRWPNM